MVNKMGPALCHGPSLDNTMFIMIQRYKETVPAIDLNYKDYNNELYIQ